MGKVKDLTGERFGRLVVIRLEGKRKNGESMWLCQCDCGNTATCISSNLSRGTSKSCGCLARELKKARGEQLHIEALERKAKAKTERRECKFIERFNDKYGHAFEYISGYKSDDTKAKIEIRCKECGAIRYRSCSNIFGKGRNIACKECDANRKGINVGICVECGEEFKQYSPKQILCKGCHAKQERQKKNAYHGARERKARENGKVDYSITLAKLIKRDKHICKLCGRKVNENDYVYIGDNFIAGNEYPSIDHIIPLSKGGVHQWDNVQLAHRLCNSIKCDRE